MKRILTFDLSEHALVGCSLTRIKTLNFLPVRLFVQIPVKAVRPTKATYSNRQVRSTYGLSSIDLTLTPISGVMPSNTLKLAFPDEGCLLRYSFEEIIGTTYKQCGATSSLKPKRYTVTDTMERFRFECFSQILFLTKGGLGETSSPALYQFPPSGKQFSLANLN